MPSVQAFVCFSVWPSPPACQIVKQYDVVFVGKVVKAGIVPHEAGPGFGYELMRARWAVSEIFKGQVQGTKMIDLEYPMAAESFRFAQGETYLVYALRGEGANLEVSTCSPTRPVGQVRADLLSELRKCSH